MSGPAATLPLEATRPRQWAGIVVLIACAALWSLNGPLIKLLDQEDVPGVTIACYRSLIGGLVFLPLAGRRLRTLRRVRPIWPIATALTFTIMTGSFVIANTLTEAANAIVLQYTSPIWVFVLAPLLLHERPGRADGLVLLISMAGVGVILLGNPPGHLPALLIALLSGCGFGTLTVLLRVLRPVSPTAVAAMNAFGSGVLLLGPTIAWGQVGLSGYATWLILALALVQFTFPYLLFSWSLQRVEAHKAALILLLEPVLNPIWTYLVVGERPPAATLQGGPLILAGVLAWLLLAWRREQRARALLRTPD
ncbi:MAG: DMT family transporter [Planctomycetota bacterium]